MVAQNFTFRGKWSRVISRITRLRALGGPFGALKWPYRAIFARFCALGRPRRHPERPESAAADDGSRRACIHCTERLTLLLCVSDPEVALTLTEDVKEWK